MRTSSHPFHPKVLQVRLTDELLQAADERAKSAGKDYLNPHSMRGLGALQVGAIGELIFMAYLLSLDIKYVDDSAVATTHDLRLLLDSEKKLDVKTKERKEAWPSYDWDCTVSDYLINHQAVDYYSFVSVTSKDPKSTSMSRFSGQSAYYLGMISKDEFLARAEFIPKGTYDWSNGFTSHKDQWNIKVEDLHSPKKEDLFIV